MENYFDYSSINPIKVRPTLRKTIPGIESSFVVKKVIGSHMRNNWHYHPEYEFLYIKKSYGTWLIGDYIGEFKSGDVILLGSCIPHSFIHEERYVQENNLNPGEAGVALFKPDILGEAFINLPESSGIRKVLQLCKRGLKMKGETRDEIGRIMEELPNVEKGRKLINLLSMLQVITEKHEYEILTSSGYANNTEMVSNDRLTQVLEYTYEHYHKTITLEEVANLVNMGTHSFCRFFKEKTGKTYIQFLMEVRIGQACKLLVEEDLQPGEVGYSCGYNSISHFNHQFKLIKNQSPLEFKRSYFNLLKV